jgi:hypothetical protein
MRNAALVAPGPRGPSAIVHLLVVAAVIAPPVGGCRPGEPSPLRTTPPAAAVPTGASAPSSAHNASLDPQSLAIPGPAALPCTSDAMCLNHRCNLAYGKCTFPCATDADCVRGTFCFKAVISTCQAKPPDE